MKLLIEYKIEKYTELVQEALQDKKNASLAEKFAPLLETERSAENIEELCGRIVTEQKKFTSAIDWG